MRRRALAATAALLALASLFAPLVRAAEQIDVALTADWSATSIALETLLGVSDVNPNAFWTLVDVLDETRDELVHVHMYIVLCTFDTVSLIFLQKREER